MGRIYLKNVNGRYYQYQRIDGEERYVGAVDPVADRGIIDKASIQQRERLKIMFADGASMHSMLTYLEKHDIEVCARTVYNYMHRNGIRRG